MPFTSKNIIKVNEIVNESQKIRFSYLVTLAQSSTMYGLPVYTVDEGQDVNPALQDLAEKILQTPAIHMILVYKKAKRLYRLLKFAFMLTFGIGCLLMGVVLGGITHSFVTMGVVIATLFLLTIVINFLANRISNVNKSQLREYRIEHNKFFNPNKVYEMYTGLAINIENRMVCDEKTGTAVPLAEIGTLFS